MQQSLEQRTVAVSGECPRIPSPSVLSQQLLDSREGGVIHDGVMLAREGFVLVGHFADVHLTPEQCVQGVLVEWFAATLVTLAGGPALRDHAVAIQVVERWDQTCMLYIKVEHPADQVG